jgi:hypothetical protein
MRNVAHIWNLYHHVGLELPSDEALYLRLHCYVVVFLGWVVLFLFCFFGLFLGGFWCFFFFWWVGFFWGPNKRVIPVVYEKFIKMPIKEIFGQLV